MWISSTYIDPIYIVLVVIMGVFIVLVGLIIIMWEFRKILKGIEHATDVTRQNTEPMRKLENHYLLLERTVTRDVEYDVDATQSIPIERVSKYLENYQRYTGQLYANGPEPTPIEPVKPLDIE